jgi:hypothetical protein
MISPRVSWNAGRNTDFKERRFEIADRIKTAISNRRSLGLTAKRCSPPSARLLQSGRFLPSRPLLSGALLLPATFLCRSRPAKYSLGEFAHFRVPEFPRCSPCAFFSAVAVIAKEPGDRGAAAKKMDLKTVGLFFGARFRVDAPDILF